MQESDKAKEKKDKLTVENMRQKAMETLSETKEKKRSKSEESVSETYFSRHYLR
jgi:soluble cytochrome b562